MLGWLRCSVDGLAEQAAVAVGLVSPEEVAPDSEVPLKELARRFSAEARALKEAGSGDSGTWLCGPPQSLAGPSKAQIDETLHRWVRRLATTNLALEALLQSLAVSIALSALSRSRPGREVLHSATRSLESGEPSEPLAAVLAGVSAMPAETLGSLMRLLFTTAEALGRRTELGVGPGDAGELEELHQWCTTLVQYAFHDAAETQLIDAGQPVESLETMKRFLAEAPPEGFNQQLLATEILDRGFRELRATCVSLAASNGTKPVRVSDVAETRLKANIACLAGLRAQHEARPMAARELAELGEEAAAASCRLEQDLIKRQERVTKLLNSIGDFPARRKEVMATCLSCERMRRQRFEEFLAALQKLLWGEDSFADFAHDPALAPTIREVIKRASDLVYQGWKDMVGVAAETLDDDNPIGAQSEDISNAASQYKAMRQELQKNLKRLGVLEERAAEGPPPSRAPRPTPAAPAKSSTAAAPVPHPKTTASAAGAPSATTTASPPSPTAPSAGRAPAAPTPPSSPPACKAGALPAAGPPEVAGLAVANAGAAATAAAAAGALATAGTPTAQGVCDTLLSPPPKPPWSRLPSVGTWLVVRLQEGPQPEESKKGTEPPCVVQDCPEPEKPPKAAIELPCVVQDCPEPEKPPKAAIEPPCVVQECLEPEKSLETAIEILETQGFTQECAEAKKPPKAEIEAPNIVAEEAKPAEALVAAAEETKLAEAPVEAKLLGAESAAVTEEAKPTEAPALAADEPEPAPAAAAEDAKPEAAPSAPTEEAEPEK